MAARGDEEVKLLGTTLSPFVMRPRIALNLKGVPYDFLQETFGAKSDLLLKSNPVYKKIPVLIHKGIPICESMIIVEYIDETWASGPSILPSDPYDRATARFWASYIDDKWYPALTGIARQETEEAKAEAVAQVHAGLQLLEEAFDKCSKGKAFFGGDGVGYLDMALGCYFGWFEAMDRVGGIKFLDEGKVPRLVKWAERFREDAAVKEVMPETETLVEYARKMVKKDDAPPTGTTTDQ